MAIHKDEFQGIFFKISENKTYKTDDLRGLRKETILGQYKNIQQQNQNKLIQKDSTYQIILLQIKKLY